MKSFAVNSSTLSSRLSVTASRKGRKKEKGVHQATVVACLLVVGKNGKVQKQVRTFRTTTRELMGLRELTRYRRKLVESRSAERNRLLKLLETASLKLASVASDVFGVSGRLMLQALLQHRGL